MNLYEFLEMGKRMVIEYWNRVNPEESIIESDININTGLDHHGVYISVMTVNGCTNKDFVVEHDTYTKRTTSYLRNKTYKRVSDELEEGVKTR